MTCDLDNQDWKTFIKLSLKGVYTIGMNYKMIQDYRRKKKKGFILLNWLKIFGSMIKWSFCCYIEEIITIFSVPPFVFFLEKGEGDGFFLLFPSFKQKKNKRLDGPTWLLESHIVTKSILAASNGPTKLYSICI